MPLQALKIAGLLFGSGFCALIYQTAWLRELRLVFGASTAASAAVLAIFMGGLGLGSMWLGRKADTVRRPLRFYAQLEGAIAVTAALTPWLVDGARAVNVALGGTVALGMVLGTVVRLVLSCLVLAVTTFLMGGTLPAAARAAEHADDHSRKHLGLLYACNTLGAVTGAALSTFLLLEVYGTRTTLWLACLINVLVAVVAASVARGLPDATPTTPAAEASAAAAPPSWVLLSAAVVGFAFLLMELVWYRMLAPLLGGSSYTFGLILALALLGIGLGGGLYSTVARQWRPTLGAFAATCVLEALFMAVPFALGDRIPVLTLLLASFDVLGFAGSVGTWTAVTTLVVFPASVVSGFQFPLLIALLGRGDHHVGRHVGWAYASNTAGSILGSLAGGFGLMPLLTAPGCWRFAVASLAALGGATLVAHRDGRTLPRALTAGAAALAVVLVAGGGPSATWRHAGVGARRAALPEPTLNGLQTWLNTTRRATHWEAEGVESSVGLLNTDGLAFVVNGKVDGNARGDAPTQVMGGLVGAALHPNPRTSLVVGLGTGSTAGWLGAIPAMERVDVVELEPAIGEVARRCAAINQDVMDNPRVHLFDGDAREVLLTTPRRYDLVFSEPSNPYRAGIASLFTSEFYRAVVERLAPGGVFVQWLQGYEVDAETVRTVMATVHQVLPHVTVWQTSVRSDLVLVASREPVPVTAAALRTRLASEPYASALRQAWRVEGLEGFLSHFVARETLVAEVARQEGGWLNTDDMNQVEFGFARSLGRGTSSILDELMELSARRGEDHLDLQGEVDEALLAEARMGAPVAQGLAPLSVRGASPGQRRMGVALGLCAQGNHKAGAEHWRALPPPGTLQGTWCATAALAEAADDAALPLLERLGRSLPTDAAHLLARLRHQQGKALEAAALVAQALALSHQDAWTARPLLYQTLEMAGALDTQLIKDQPQLAARVLAQLETPFPVFSAEERRMHQRVMLAARVDWNRCVGAVAAFEPHVPWSSAFLEHRLECYRRHADPRATVAQADLAEFLSHSPRAFAEGFSVDTAR